MPDATLAERKDRFDLRALYETSRLLSASLDLEFVLGNLLLTAMSKLLVTRGAALLFDPLEGLYRVASAKGLPNLEPQVRLEAFPTDGPLRGGDVPPPLAEHGVELVLPVAFGHRKIGLIGLGKKATGQPFADAELEFIASLVNMSSAAVHNSLMVEELQQANRDLDHKIQQLNTLFDLSQEFNATVERDRLVKLLSFALMGQMLVGKQLFLLRQPGETGGGGAGFQVVVARGVEEPSLEAALLSHLCGLRSLVMLQDGEDGAPELDGLRRRGLALILPVRHQGQVCALLGLGPKLTGQPYTADDVDFLTALGNLAFVSIQNTFLIEEQIEKERLEEEMRLARSIQEGLLPSVLPEVDGVGLAALAIPSREVGGDYYDAVGLEGGRLFLAVADVTGKGVPASLLMANLQAGIHTMLPMDLLLEEATGHLNRVICQNTGFDKFITFVHGIYHPADGRFDYVNAGHNPPMRVRPSGEIELLETGGLLLGVMKSMPYERGTVVLEPGDVLALFTDGVTEAMSPDEQEYTEERLEACLRRHRHEPAQAILDAIRADVRAFTHDPTRLSDDLTLIIMKVEEQAEKA